MAEKPSLKVPVLLRQKEALFLQVLPSKEKIPAQAVLVGSFDKEEASWVPSPTLFLNANLAFFDEDQLLAIALAEKARFEENLFREYLLDTRKPIALLAREAQKLERFLEIYGGLLDLHPFCLGKSPSFPLVEELDFQKTPEGYRLSYLLWSPIDQERCQSCGLCGHLCPQKAIRPDLSFDPTLCDLCRLCEKACPTGAIDLSRYEEIEEEFAYLLFLDEPPQGLFPFPGHLFTADQLESFFSQLGVFQVVESVRFEPGACQFVSRLSLGCRLCVENCPQEALSWKEEGLFIDHFRCQDCGKCVSLCPTGALQEARFDDRSLISYFQALPFLEGYRLVVGTEETLKAFWWYKRARFPKTFFLVHPNPPSLHAMALVFLLSQGFSEIIFLSSSSHGKELVNDLFESLFNRRPVHTLEADDLVSWLAKPAPPSWGRLEKLSYLGRRKTLARLVSFFWEKAQRPSIHLTGESLGEVKIKTEGCTLCLACLNGCQIQALAADPDHFALTYTAFHCVACGACVEICPEGVLTLSNGLEIKEEAFSACLLAQDEPIRCRRCGKIFGTKKAQERVVQKLASLGRFEEVLNLLDLCEDCRVIAFFEDQK